MDSKHETLGVLPLMTRRYVVIEDRIKQWLLIDLADRCVVDEFITASAAVSESDRLNRLLVEGR